MKSYRKELWFDIPSRRGFVCITPQVRQALEESGIKEGLCLVNAMHITASVFINDNEQGFTGIMKTGWNNWRPMSPLAAIVTIAQVRIMEMPT